MILRKHLDPRVASLDQNTKAASRSGIIVPSAWECAGSKMPRRHFNPGWSLFFISSVGIWILEKHVEPKDQSASVASQSGIEMLSAF